LTLLTAVATFLLGFCYAEIFVIFSPPLSVLNKATIYDRMCMHCEVIAPHFFVK